MVDRTKDRLKGEELWRAGGRYRRKCPPMGFRPENRAVPRALFPPTERAGRPWFGRGAIDQPRSKRRAFLTPPARSHDAMQRAELVAVGIAEIGEI